MVKCKVCGAKFRSGICPACGDSSHLEKYQESIGLFAPGESESIIDENVNYAYSRTMRKLKKGKHRRKRKINDFEQW